MSIVLPKRKRLTQDESRAAAVAAARALLLDQGAAAITLKAVAAKIGRTHANLLHHFGSVAGLHRALAEDIAVTVSASITSAIASRRKGLATERDVVDAMFDAFVRDGAGELIGWIALTRQRDALQPVIDTIAAIVADFAASGDQRPMGEVTLGLVLLAVGDSLVGNEVAKGTGQTRAQVREIAVNQIAAVVARR